MSSPRTQPSYTMPGVRVSVSTGASNDHADTDMPTPLVAFTCTFRSVLFTRRSPVKRWEVGMLPKPLKDTAAPTCSHASVSLLVAYKAKLRLRMPECTSRTAVNGTTTSLPVTCHG